MAATMEWIQIHSGFEYWYAMTQGHTASFYNMETAWEGKVYNEPGYYIEATTRHALDFLDRIGDRPFFLHVGFNGPYCVDGDLLAGHRNRHTSYYADKELACFPRTEPDDRQVTFREAFGNPVARRSYAAAISGVDDGVGAILTKLELMGVADNTLVVFTADHGACAGHHGMWGFGEHARPFNLFQEVLRVPLIFRHPARIPAGGSVETMVSNYDLLPSLLGHLSLQGRLPDSPPPAGRSYAPALLGQELDRGEQIVFHEYENTRAVQTTDWKLIRRRGDEDDELYDLQTDPGERDNLIGRSEYAETARQLTDRLGDFFRRYSDPQYDLWAGGRSKAGEPITG